MKKIPIWLDTDTGVDDAFAILTALQLEKAELVGVSAVMGNTNLDNTFRNARDVLALGGRSDIPVYAGAASPWLIPHRHAEHIHGESGLGNAKIPTSEAPIETEKAWDALCQKACEYDGELEVVAIGPLTNIATALISYPDLCQKIKRIVIMGGAVEKGNVTPCAEFNIYVDPQAAEAVFKSGVPVVMFGLDVTTKAYLSGEDIQEIEAFGNKAGDLFKDAMALAIEVNSEQIGKNGLLMHDALPVLSYDIPEAFIGKECGVFVETQGEITFGKTVADVYTDQKFGVVNTTVMLDCDRDQFASVFKEYLKRY